MAGNSQMNENERNLFALNGITGMLIATVLLISILVGLTILNIGAQQNNAQKFYKINQDLNGLKANSPDNVNQYELVGKSKE
jgi:hypothetical protein